MKGQSSIEYIILIGMLLAAVIPLLFYATTKSSNEIRLNQADQSVQTIAKAADNVYTAGPGNREYIQVTLPTGTKNFTVSGRDILITIGIYGGNSNVHARAIAPIVNTTPLPMDQGTYNLVVRMTEKELQISTP